MTISVHQVDLQTMYGLQSSDLIMNLLTGAKDLQRQPIIALPALNTGLIVHTV